MTRTGHQAKHPKVATTHTPTTEWRGMGQRPMVAKRYDPEFSAACLSQVSFAVAAVCLAPLPVRDLKSRYFFT